MLLGQVFSPIVPSRSALQRGQGERDSRAWPDAVSVAVVTGGTGVLGKHAVRMLGKRGHEVRVISRGTGVNLATREAVDEAVKGADLVLHAASDTRRMGASDARRRVTSSPPLAKCATSCTSRSSESTRSRTATTGASSSVSASSSKAASRTPSCERPSFREGVVDDLEKGPGTRGRPGDLGALLAGGVSEASAAYPQTRPSAGQFCKARHVGVVSKAANGRLVKCSRDGSYNRWRYVWR
jgi:NAD dependent epimerase/dehydratase family